MTKLQVKICCISSIGEAQMAIKYGATILGLVAKMPSGPGVISDKLIKQIAQSVPPSISTFLLTSETKAEDIISHYKRCLPSAIQLVDKVEKREYAIIRKHLPKLKIVQVIHIVDDSSIHEAIKISKYVDAILLDSGNPHLKIKELGGTGKTHNWQISKEIRKSITTPLYLAGGINKNNVGEAIQTVEPFGIDLCSGVRTKGKLDEFKLKAFFKAIEKSHI